MGGIDGVESELAYVAVKNSKKETTVNGHVGEIESGDSVHVEKSLDTIFPTDVVDEWPDTILLLLHRLTLDQIGLLVEVVTVSTPIFGAPVAGGWTDIDAPMRGTDGWENYSYRRAKFKFRVRQNIIISRKWGFSKLSRTDYVRWKPRCADIARGCENLSGGTVWGH